MVFNFNSIIIILLLLLLLLLIIKGVSLLFFYEPFNVASSIRVMKKYRTRMHFVTYISSAT